MSPAGTRPQARRVPRALVVSGRGRFEDPWHDTAATSHEVACGAERAGLDVEIRGTFPGVFDDLTDVSLVVVNACLPRSARDDDLDGSDAQWSTAAIRLLTYARSGGSLLVLHQGIRTFEGTPEDSAWREVAGGRWVDGTSWHPERGPFDAHVADREHPITAAFRAVERVVDDEAYTDLEVAPSAHVLMTHRQAGVDHPIVWVQTAHGGRTVYDALGHDASAARQRLRRDLLERAIRWLVPELSTTPAGSGEV